MSYHSCGKPSMGAWKTRQALAASLGPRLTFLTRDPCRFPIQNLTLSRTGNETYPFPTLCGRSSIYARQMYRDQGPQRTLLWKGCVHWGVQTSYILHSTHQPPSHRKAEGLQEPSWNPINPLEVGMTIVFIRGMSYYVHIRGCSLSGHIGCA